MPEQDPNQDKVAIFRLFEASLSDKQRQLLLRHPDLLSPELINQLYQASLERLSEQHTEPAFSPKNTAVDHGGKIDQKKPRKMVNSWMTFRSYYSPLIKDLPQKVRSPMLALLWRNDVDHGLWELLSAAFSYIRDNHSEDGISIDQFLVVAAQIVPVIPPNQYFARSGWTRAGDTLKRIETSPQELSKATNLSCAEIIRYCFRQGLISRPPMIARGDPGPTGNQRKYPSGISFATAASSLSASLNFESREQAVIQTRSQDGVGISCFSSAQDIVPTGRNLKVVDQTGREITTTLFPRFEDTELSTTAQIESALLCESEFWTTSEEFGRDSHGRDEFWMLTQ